MIELRDYQCEALGALRQSIGQGCLRIVLQAPTGCHAAGTKVLMLDGTTKAVEDVKVGDWLMGPDSVMRVVLALHRGQDEMARIVPTRGDPFVVNVDHVLSLEQTNLPDCDRRSIYNGEWRNITVSEYLRQTAEFKHLHKLHRSRGIEFEDRHAEGRLLDAYFLGVLLGDGSFTSARAAFSVTSEDDEIADYMAVIAWNYGMHMRQYRSTGRARTLTITGGQLRKVANPIAVALRTLGLHGCGSGDKFVPVAYKIAPRDVRLAVLAGLIDTDGSLSTGVFDYVTKSLQLAKDVAFIARSLGLCVTLTVKTLPSGKYKGRTYHRLCISGDLNAVPTRVARKKAGLRQQIKSPHLTGFTVELCGRDDYYGFELDDDGLYLLDDFTITHNSGKTAMAGAIAAGAVAKNNRMAFVVPNINLIDQTVRAFAKQGITEVGVIQQDHTMTNPDRPVQVCSIQTLQARKMFTDAAVVVFDEVHVLHKHHIAWLADEKFTKVPFIGLSATPWTRGLGRYFQSLHTVATTQQMIDQGHLSKFRTFAVAAPDLNGVRIVAGDYHEGELSERCQQGKLTADIVQTWQERWGKDHTLVFAVDCAHARQLVERFEKAGVVTAYQDAQTPMRERNIIREKFQKGEVQVIVNIQTMTIGVDLDVRCISFCRPTRSEMLFVQCIGRGLRTAEGKDCLLLLDHSGTTERLGFVTDIDVQHDRLDDGRPKKDAAKKREAPLPKACGQCGYMAPKRERVCSNCGHEHPWVISRIVERDGTLVEVTGQRRKASDRPVHHAEVSEIERKSWFAQLRWIGKDREYKPSWAMVQYKERFGDWPPDAWRFIDPQEPGLQVKGWVKSRMIAYFKSKRFAERAAP